MNVIVAIWRTLVYFVGGIFSTNDREYESGHEFFTCHEPNCQKVFKSRSGRDKHARRTHQIHERKYCRHGCGKSYIIRSNHLNYHERTCDYNPDGAMIGRGISQQYFEEAGTSDECTRMELIKSSHERNYRIYRSHLAEKSNIPERLRDVIMHDARDVIKSERDNVKFMITATVIYEKAMRPGVFTDPPVYFKTTPVATTHVHSIDEVLDGMYEHVLEQILAYQQNGSGWIMQELRNIDLQVCTILATKVLIHMS